MCPGKDRIVPAIPAASLDGVDIAAIRRLDVSAADEIERIGAALTAGTDSEADLVHLCRLLLKFGERGKVEALLSASADDTDGGRLFRELFATRIEAFEAAIHAFQAQFSVTLSTATASRALHRVFQIDHCDSTSSDAVVLMLKTVGCEVDLRDEEGIVADVQVRGEIRAIPMVYTNGTWRIDHDHVGARWLHG